MDFRCFLIKGDWVERLSDGCQMKIKEVHANEIVCNDYDPDDKLWHSLTLKDGECCLALRTH